MICWLKAANMPRWGNPDRGKFDYFNLQSLTDSRPKESAY